MMYAEKGNKVIQVSEQEMQRYIAQGFTITDDKGTVLKDAVPTDPSSLKQAYNKHIAEIANLKKTIAELETKVKTLEKVIAETSKPVEREEPVEEKAEPKPRSGRKSQKSVE